MCLLWPVAFSAVAQDYIPATNAFNSPGCSADELGGVDIGITTVPSPQRANPEWKAIILDSTQPPHLQPPQILEGFVLPTPNDETSESQASAEVAEEDHPWTHFTHDWTFKVLPDPNYQYLLSSWEPFPGETFPKPDPYVPDDLFAGLCTSKGGSVINNECVVPREVCPDGVTGTTCHHIDMEVEWDNASLMEEHEGRQRTWGAVPEFVWSAVGDRVWLEGRWIFDCGHPGTPAAAPNSTDYVKFSTEIHPPRALVTFRLNHTVLDSFPVPRVSAPNFPGRQSFLPVTGEPAILPPDAPNSGPTQVPVTEADIFISGNGGAANDICSIVPASCSEFGGHTGAIIPVNDRNYVFDIYPPGTDYLGFTTPNENGNFGVASSPDASLQWRIVDHFNELPDHACGGDDKRVCVTVDPIICPVDFSTPPPDQTETSCPPVPAHPTRLRVILPFAGTNANFFAKSILVGWDDVPTPENRVRTFRVQLHKLTVKENGAGPVTDADWRVFLNVGGQWRYISPFFDTNANGNAGIKAFDGGDNLCEGDALTENGDDDCFQFNNTPWTVSVQNGIPIHVGVGGFVARGVEDFESSLFMCRNYPWGCDTPDFSIFDLPFRDFPFSNDDRIGTYEFDLVGPDYAPPAPFTTAEFGCSINTATGCNLQYKVEFSVNEFLAATPPASDALQIGAPHYGSYVSSATRFTLSSSDATARGFQYRFHRQGDPLPTYSVIPISDKPVPVHWVNADFPSGSHSLSVYLAGIGLTDGAYDLQYSANSFANLLEGRHTQSLMLDNTAPVTTITAPAATQYVHSDTFKIGYSTDDGTGSGVKSDDPNIDGLTTLQDGTPVALNETVRLLTALTLGTHTFNVVATDNVGNTGTTPVVFTVIVTAESIKQDVTQFVAAGKITVDRGQSLLGILNNADKARAAGDCKTASLLYQAFIRQVTTLSGKQIDSTAAQIMIGDAQYLIAHCP
jgi:hypothetical protein